MRLLIATLALTSIALLGCDEDQNKVAQAQKCLNEADEATPSAAAACLTFIQNVNSQQASVLKCAINFASGGVTTTRITNAYKASGGGTTQDAAFITGLAFGAGSDAAARALAAEAVVNCNASKVEGLMYLANLSVIGTELSIAAGLTATINGDPNFNPDASAGAIATALGNCDNPGTQCNEASVGSAVIVLADSYCNGGNDNTGPCKDVNAAIAAAGSDPAAVADQLFALLQTN